MRHGSRDVPEDVAHARAVPRAHLLRAEATEAYEALGVTGFDGYFASRAAAMGPVPAEVVIATFFNFNPDVVRQAIPAAWQVATPRQLVDARFAAADAALRRALGTAVEGEDVAQAADPGSHRRRGLPARGPSAVRRPVQPGVARGASRRAVARHLAAARVPRRRAPRRTGRRGSQWHRRPRLPRRLRRGSPCLAPDELEVGPTTPGTPRCRASPLAGSCRTTAPSPPRERPCASTSRTAPTCSPWRRGRRWAQTDATAAGPRAPAQPSDRRGRGLGVHQAPLISTACGHRS